MPITNRLRVAKCPAYVRRVHSWGMGDNSNWIACWYAVDEQNMIVAGGYQSGNNMQSGYASMPRRKDAIAFVEGFHWAQDNFEKLSRKNYCEINGVENPYSHRNTGKLYDVNMEALFMDGVSAAYAQLVECKNYKRAKLPARGEVSEKHYTLKGVPAQKPAPTLDNAITP